MPVEFIDPYLIPGTTVLRNLLGFTESEKLSHAEYDLTLARRQQLHRDPIKGNFDLKHVQAIHRHLFQDLFDWAGEVRTVDISKQGSQFSPVATIQVGSKYTFDEIHKGPLLRKELLSDELFVEHIATLFERLNYLHPFREGNGRTQRAFLDQIAAVNGHILSWRNVGEHDHIRASIESFDAGSGEPYKWVFKQIMKPPRDGLSPLDSDLYLSSAPTTSQAPGKYQGRVWPNVADTTGGESTDITG